LYPTQSIRISYSGIQNSELKYNNWYTSANVQYNTELFSNTISIILDATNLFDNQYISVNGYPEPRRIAKFNIKYEISD